MPKIALSYRRADSDAITGRIFDRLQARYGRQSIFRDIDNIPVGVDFRAHINAVLDDSDMVLVIVGPRWTSGRGTQSRLGNPADPVRIEVETALRKGTPVIPVLVGSTGMPKVEQLPDSLEDFAYRNGVRIDTGQDFDLHIERLIRAIDGISEAAAADREQSPHHTTNDVPDPEAVLAVDAPRTTNTVDEPGLDHAPVPRPSRLRTRLLWAAIGTILLVSAGTGVNLWINERREQERMLREVAIAEAAHKAALESAREAEARARQRQEDAVRATRLEAESKARQQQAAAVETAKREAEEEARGEKSAAAAAALKRETEAKTRAATPPRRLYGALAVDEPTAKWGFSWGEKTPSAAEAAAIKACEAETCKIVLGIAKKMCVALARVESGTAWGAATRTDRAKAEDAAIMNCQKRSEHECAVRGSECYR
jgi:hypothetical protein